LTPDRTLRRRMVPQFRVGCCTVIIVLGRRDSKSKKPNRVPKKIPSLINCESKQAQYVSFADTMRGWAPWIRVLFQKLIVTQLVNNFPAFYGALRFITTFTTGRHWSLSWATCIQSTTFQRISLRPIQILSSQLHTSSKWSIPFSSGIKNFVHTSLPCVLHDPPDITWFYHPKVRWHVFLISALLKLREFLK